MQISFNGLYIFFEKKSAFANTSGAAAKRHHSSAIKSEIMSNQQLADELNKAVLTKVKKHRVNSSFKDNIYGKDLADM